MKVIAGILFTAWFALGADQPKATPQPVVSKPLDPAAKEALKVERGWQNGDPMPMPGENGSVVFRYGAAMPPIVCAPERLTTILLQPGERISDKPILGDSLRWDYQLRTSGEGPDAREAIIIKPTAINISTDLVLFTNLRHYILRLESRPTEHLTEVAFSYPQTATSFASFKAAVEKSDQVKAEPKTALISNPAPVTDGVKPVVSNCAYTISVSKGKHPPFTPTSVCDDGKHTRLKMPETAANWETAVLETAGPNGCETVNYRIEGRIWVADRLFDTAELLSGGWKHAQIVKITRNGAANKSAACNKSPAHAEDINLAPTGE